MYEGTVLTWNFGFPNIPQCISVWSLEKKFDEKFAGHYISVYGVGLHSVYQCTELDSSLYVAVTWVCGVGVHMACARSQTQCCKTLHWVDSIVESISIFCHAVKGDFYAPFLFITQSQSDIGRKSQWRNWHKLKYEYVWIGKEKSWKGKKGKEERKGEENERTREEETDMSKSHPWLLTY